MDSYINDNRLSRKAVESCLGGYEGVDPLTGLQAWFVNGVKEWIWGGFHVAVKICICRVRYLRGRCLSERLASLTASRITPEG